MVGLPAAGGTTRAEHLADHLGALRLTPDEWMIPLFADHDADGKRDVLERHALHQLAIDHGAQCATVHLPVDRDTEWARVHQRWQDTPHETYPMTEAEVDRWRGQFQEPDAAELGGASPPPPPPWPSWEAWAAERWPSLSPA